MYTIYFAHGFVFSLLTLTLTLTVQTSTSPSMNCVYAPLGSISAKLSNFHKYLISKEFFFFYTPCVYILSHIRMYTKIHIDTHTHVYI